MPRRARMPILPTVQWTSNSYLTHKQSLEKLSTAGKIRSGQTAWRWPPAHGRLYRSGPEHAAQHISQLGPAGTHFLPSIVSTYASTQSSQKNETNDSFKSITQFIQLIHSGIGDRVLEGQPGHW